MNSRTISVLLASALGLFAAGCSLPQAQPDLTRYYVLTSPPPVDDAAPRPASAVVVGLKAIELPTYLKSRSLLVRNGANEIIYQDTARWAEPLDASLARIFREGLQSSSEVGRVAVPPFPVDEPRAFDVAIRIVRCEAGRSGDRHVVRFTAVYEITVPGPGGRVVVRKNFAAAESDWDGKDYGTLARLLSEGAAEFGKVVAEELALKK